MTVENQIYFDAYHNLHEVKALENAVLNNGVPANALHIYADKELIEDKEWLLRISGVNEAQQLIGYKKIDSDKPIIVGIDECHQDKIPVIKFAMEQYLKDMEEDDSSSNAYSPLRDTHPVFKLPDGTVVSKFDNLSDEQVQALVDAQHENHGDFPEHEQAQREKDAQDNVHHDTELEEAEIGAFEKVMRQDESVIPPEEFGVNQDNFQE